MDEKRRQALMTYCRLDDLSPEEDALLEALYHSAVEYMARSGVREPGEEDPGRLAAYSLCVSCLVLDAWERRSAAVSGTISDNPAFQRMKNQLKYSEPDDKPGI